MIDYFQLGIVEQTMPGCLLWVESGFLSSGLLIKDIFSLLDHVLVNEVSNIITFHTEGEEGLCSGNLLFSQLYMR